ncbi:hypothetical protein B0H16DRAFT_1478902 [Mycena metata]|uniref:Uncharacterized protein n=1 Tax=Mycena metata TaxID=1033252 RepID=A0AAD7ME19_9AGAR|nr:hypothetical protein B0H16DRAFT_1478902 [Mycena metata]
MNVGLDLKYSDLLDEEWEAKWWLEQAYGELADRFRRQEWTDEGTDFSDSDDWFDDSDSDDEPPPPPTVGTAARAVDSASELGEQPELEEVSDSDSESELDVIPDLQDISDSDSDGIPDLREVSDSDSEGSEDKLSVHA